jgi:hypothetical protein
MAFRDRTVLTLSPTQVRRLAIRRAGTTYELAAPVESGQSTHWRMVAPVTARADEEAVTKVVMLLNNLQAERYVTDQLGDGKAFGLEAPALTVTWTTPTEVGEKKDKSEEQGASTGTLRVGAKLPKSDSWYANIEGSPVVFTLPGGVLALFEAEFHSHRVLAVPKETVRRLVLRWPGRTLAFRPQETPAGKGFRWVPEQGSDAAGFDVSRVDSLFASLASLNTPKFLQYSGPIPAATGLQDPRLVIEVHQGDDREPRVLRIGQTTDTEAIATTASGASGPVFLLTGPAWSDLARHVPGGAGLPEDVFTPESAKSPRGEAKAPPR